MVIKLPQNAPAVFIEETPVMTPARVVETGKKFGQKIGKKEARVISGLLRGWRG